MKFRERRDSEVDNGEEGQGERERKGKERCVGDPGLTH